MKPMHFLYLFNIPALKNVCTVWHTNKCIPIKCVLSYIFIHQHVSVASATIISVA